MGDVKNRNYRVELANETMKVMNKGEYLNGSGNIVNIQSKIEFAINNSILYRPDGFNVIEETVNNIVLAGKNENCKKATIEVTDESTIDASYRLVGTEKKEQVCCLNFASAKNPGGGFLSGSSAQEESLARSSGLYKCINQMEEMYNYNKSRKTCLYSDYMIYSPQVPFFRQNSGEFLDEPFCVSVITSPAVNAGIVRQREEEGKNMIDKVMIQRIKRILAVMYENKNSEIILGAFGCGVFRNNPKDVAEYFRKILIDDGYEILFDKIIFAIYKNTKDSSNFDAFKEYF